jgi:hypothetical protein
MSKAIQNQRRDESPSPDEAQREALRVDVNHRARRALAKHNQLRASAEGLSFELQNDVLVVRGCVPSFYLKQMLQTALTGLDGVRQIDNQVEVLVANGLGQDRRPPDLSGQS